MELSHIEPDIIPYDEVALDCATRGYLQPLERSLMKINILDDTLLPKCVLRAILNGHYDIANHIVCDNFDRAFYSVFPDGRVPAEFFATLIDSDKVSQGDQIATSLLRYLPKLDVQRLRRLIERDRTVSRSALMMLDGMYSEITDNREYPCDYD
ncbi:hypothetical protein DdX_01290 [Ditylenchus destructor]|uniref:Uncharacterized protein n=1 Tax=Ditylenchus destructor TaxID=166010 RepID=A0AAD4NGJ4_9BILA|nr:hypothetical protein DdX_01290 [Ditylenchus destructor]